ncbi:MAG: flagellar basal body P-ring protein FlgI [Alphaproteobacteria bacterium]|nr:flagellar basal body P-ring protein FlgI [Alphaproteobacteria bacterium]
MPSLPTRALSLILSLAVAAFPVFPGSAYAYSRIKDVVDVEGVRDNVLMGVGLVVGLNGTGDSLRNAPFTLQAVQSLLEQQGINTRSETLNTKNIAFVTVTATLPPFATAGTKIDVTVSTMGDAKSLQGGTLLVTSLQANGGQTYAVAQGPIAIAGFTAGGEASTVTQGVPTAGRIANGATIEKEIDFDLAQMKELRLALRNPDFTTARRIAQSINTYVGGAAAQMLDPGTVLLRVPANYTGNIVSLVTDIEQLRVDPDTPARVVIDEASGIIVMGSDVRINEVAIAQGNLTIRVTETPQVSQPSPFAEEGETVIVPRTDIQIDEGKDNKLIVMRSGVSLQTLVNGLNALGVGPRDMIAILQAIKTAGALQAEIEVM